MGLLLYADSRTIDFNGFLQLDVRDETAAASGVATYEFRYIPSTDNLQVIDKTTGKELVNGTTLPAVLLTDILVFEATWNRTTTLG